ncbi:MAG: efflux RND transporter periplasmic adaptor subunit [Pseudomonadota bacterium]
MASALSPHPRPLSTRHSPNALRWLATLAVALLIAGTGPAPATAQTIPVKLMMVEPTRNVRVRTFFGQVVAKQTVDLSFQVGGQVVELNAVEGQPVEAGSLLAQLDQEPFELSLQRSEVNLAQAERTRDRMQQLRGNAVSQATVDDAQTQFDLARVALDDARYALRQSTLRAPFDAVVARRHVSNFTTIAAGTQIVRLHDLSELRIEIDVPELLFQQAGEDPDVMITATFPVSPTAYPLEIREVTAETSQIGQTFRVVLGMPPPQGLALLPGASVTVTATLSGGAPRLVVPTNAIATGANGQTSVFVFDSADGQTGTLRATAVDVAVSETGDFHIVSGLDAGAEIAVAGVNSLDDGQSVRRFNGFGQ